METYRLTFKDDCLDKLLNHMKNNKRRIPYTTDETQDYGLWLVKDDGIYLMSPTDVRYNRVVYANGFDPQIDDEDDQLWNRTYAISPDDFAEFVPLTEEMMNKAMDTKEIIVDLSKHELTVSV